MSIHRTPTGAWRVRWRHAGHNRSKVLGSKRDAIAFDAELRRRARLGELAQPDHGDETLDTFARESWWPTHAAPNLAASTLVSYADLWDRHVMPRLGDLPLRQITPEVCQRFAADLQRAGLGAPTRRRALVLLSGVLRCAVEWGRIPANPVRTVRKPSQRRQRAVVPLAPTTVEAIRAALGQRDATLVSVLAYAGLRPGEALGLRWADVGARTLLVERAVADGQVKSTKTGQTRSVRLLAPLRADLAAWRLASGRPADSALIFPRRDGAPWRDTDYRNWRRRVYEPAARAAGLAGPVRVYDLRHSFVSLLIAEGASIVDLARQAGHAPTLALDTYGHVIEELAGGERRSAEDAIRAAREQRVPSSFLVAGDADPAGS